MTWKQILFKFLGGGGLKKALNKCHQDHNFSFLFCALKLWYVFFSYDSYRAVVFACFKCRLFSGKNCAVKILMYDTHTNTIGLAKGGRPCF